VRRGVADLNFAFPRGRHLRHLDRRQVPIAGRHFGADGAEVFVRRILERDLFVGCGGEELFSS